MIDVIGEVLVRIAIIFMITCIMFGMIELYERVSDIETQLQMLIEMEKEEDYEI